MRKFSEMRQNLLIILFIILTVGCFAQVEGHLHSKESDNIHSSNKINGQWRGYFDEFGNISSFMSNNTEFVLEIDIDGTEIRGNSYTYFQDRKYYVICSLTGKFDRSTNTIEVIETARIKGVTPPNWVDCLQKHILTYKKENGIEKLVGKWCTAEGQTSNCGSGETVLTRKTLKNSIAGYKPPKPANTPVTAPKTEDIVSNNLKPRTVKPHDSISKSQPGKIIFSPVPTSPQPITEPGKALIKKETPMVVNEAPIKKTPEENELDKRKNRLIQTIEIKNEKFDVILYDNGVVDGDSISLFYNGKLLLSHQMLSEKPIKLTLDANTGKDINELVMYAENLGTIPPNTALMIVNDGDKRYEVRIISDLQNSGTIRFIHKSKNN